MASRTSACRLLLRKTLKASMFFVMPVPQPSMVQKAANGVIIVTTKKGSKNGKTNVNYSGYVAIDNTLKTLDMMNASELLAYANANNVDLSPTTM